ncbi:hypothetical protein OESDEN_22950, partial [Oesophagostomum dentatum]
LLYSSKLLTITDHVNYTVIQIRNAHIKAAVEVWACTPVVFGVCIGPRISGPVYAKSDNIDIDVALKWNDFKFSPDARISLKIRLDYGGILLKVLYIVGGMIENMVEEQVRGQIPPMKNGPNKERIVKLGRFTASALTELETFLPSAFITSSLSCFQFLK